MPLQIVRCFIVFGNRMPEMQDLSRCLAVRICSDNSILCKLCKKVVLLRKELHMFCIYFSNQKNMPGSFELMFPAVL